MTERDPLRALARAAGLRVSEEDLKTLLPAWKRYTRLIEELRAALPVEPENNAG